MIRLRAHAKVNLALRVGPLGDDGYHALATVFQTVSLADLLYARLAEDGPGPGRGLAAAPEPADGMAGEDLGLLRLSVEGASLPPDNTLARAIAGLAGLVMARRGKKPPPVRVRLVKRIPIGAGLGGGSSDAAAALAACLLLWGIGRDELSEGPADSDPLAGVARAVGADVPFFLAGGTALGTGRGSEIEPLPDLRPQWMVLAAPDVAVSTPAAYRWFDDASEGAAIPGSPNGAVPSSPSGAIPSSPSGAIPSSSSGAIPSSSSSAVPSSSKDQPEPPEYTPELDPSWMGNDLAAAVGANCPAVEVARTALVEEGASVAQMTGSGSACFGVFADRRSASRAAGGLRAAGFWARPCTTIDQRQHKRTWP